MEDISSPIILMYHGVLSDRSLIPADRETGAALYDVSIENFKAQLNVLTDLGYSARLAGQQQAGDASKPIVITFDDGEMNNFRYAFPVLQELGWKAYFFVIVKRIGKKGY